MNLKEAWLVLFEATADKNDQPLVKQARKVAAVQIERLRHRYSNLTKSVAAAVEREILVVKSICSAKFRVSVTDMEGPLRPDRIVQARHAAMWLLMAVGFTRPVVADTFGCREQSTVSHAISVVNDRLKWDSHYRSIMRMLVAEVEKSRNGHPVQFSQEFTERLEGYHP